MNEAPATPTKATAPQRRKLPSGGFVALCAVYAGVVVFFVWGLWTPDLDRVWQLHHELKAGRIGAPKGHERAVLVESMRRHPELAGALLQHGEIGLISSHDEGFIAMPEATIVRTARASERFIVLEAVTPASLMPFEVAVNGQGWSKTLRIDHRGSFGVELPKLDASRKESEVITVKVKGRELRADPSMLGLRVAFSVDAPNDKPEAT